MVAEFAPSLAPWRTAISCPVTPSTAATRYWVIGLASTGWAGVVQDSVRSVPLRLASTLVGGTGACEAGPAGQPPKPGPSVSPNSYSELPRASSPASCIHDVTTCSPSSTRSASAAEYMLNVDRKSTRLNSSHANISYAVFCLKKKKHRPNSSDLLPIHSSRHAL